MSELITSDNDNNIKIFGTITIDNTNNNKNKINRTINGKEFTFDTTIPIFTSAILSDTDILKRLDQSVIINPFNLNQLKNSTYDVTLGDTIWRRNPNFKGIINSSSKTIMDNYWSIKENAQIALDDDLIAGINKGDKFFILNPLETVLAHTTEFIGGTYDITTQLKAKSTTGRSLLTVCMCAGQGDIGYFNRWTLEIKNHSPEFCSLIKVNHSYAQVVFFQSSKPQNQYSEQGHYQNCTNLDQLIKNWTPEQMRPHALS